MSHVPAPDTEALFASARDSVGQYFEGLVRHPERGTIEVGDQRYTLVRAGSMSVEFFDVVRSIYGDTAGDQATEVARSILFDVAHGMGLADARVFAQKMSLTDAVARLSAGTAHFAHAGWASVELLPESNLTATDDFVLVYNHPYSFESDAWLAAGKRSDQPVCVMNAGYSSGWCESSFGQPLVAVELTCVASGDSQCQFLMAPPHRIRDRIAEYLARNPDVSCCPDTISVPGFFARKEAQEALRARASALRKANEVLEQRVLLRTSELEAANQRLTEELAERQAEAQHRRLLEQHVAETQRLESLGVLAGGVAHDFNNLLAGVLGNAEIVALGLETNADPDMLRHRVDLIRRSVLRAAGLTNQLLTYAGKRESSRDTIDLSSLVADMMELLRTSIPKQTTFHHDLGAALPPVSGDPAQIQQVVLNLVLNAAESLREGEGVLTLQTDDVSLTASDLQECRVVGEGTPGRYVRLLVTDTGCGMSADTANRMFEPFFSTKFTGRGLGLAALRGIVTSHDAHLRVSSVEGEGTTMEVFFAPNDADVTHGTRRESGGALPLEGRTVLVVDDEDCVLDMTVDMLEAMGCSAMPCMDGLEALDTLKALATPPDLVVLDMTMPGLSGMETLERIRADHPTLPVVMVSGFTVDEVRFDASTAFVRKPFRMADLRDAVARALT